MEKTPPVDAYAAFRPPALWGLTIVQGLPRCGRCEGMLTDHWILTAVRVRARRGLYVVYCLTK